MSKINAFPFENFLGKLKKLVRTPNLPLSQVCRRIHEKSLMEMERSMIIDRIIILKKDSIQNDTVNVQKMKYNSFILTNNSPNNIVCLKNNKIFCISKIFYSTQAPEDIKLEGYTWKVKADIFCYPAPSINLNMCQLESQHCKDIFVISVNTVKKKC